MKAFIESIQFALPARVLDNEELARDFPEWSAEKIYAKTGIKRRHVASEKECASDLAVRAATKVFDEGGLDRGRIDFVLNCTQTPDFLAPATACLLQDRLGLPTSCGAVDLNLGCSGYIYGLGLAKALIASGQAHDVLFIAADTFSKLLHPKDKSVRTLFGDAASATLIRAHDVETLVGPFVFGTDGSGADNLIVPAGGMRRRRVADAELDSDGSGSARTINDFRQNGTAVFDFVLRVLPDAVSRLLDEASLRLEDVDLFVFHQANGFILEHLRKKLGIRRERFVLALENTGNTISSTIPIALREAADAGRLTPGSLVMLVGFGAGYSWGATLIRWHE